MDASAPERFVGIDVADAGEHLLIHENLLYFAVRPEIQALTESFKGEVRFKRLWPDAFGMFRFVEILGVDQCHLGEFS